MVRLVLKVRHPDVADAAVQDAGFDAADGDDLPGDGEILGLGEAFPVDGEDHLAALGPPDLFHRLHEGDVLGGGAVDLEDLIPGLEAGLVGGGAFDGGDHGEDAVLQGDFDADAAELALGFNLQFFEFLGSHEGGMGVQGAHRALQGAINQVLGGLGLRIMLLDEGQGLGEDFELGVADGRKRQTRFGAGSGRERCSHGSKGGAAIRVACQPSEAEQQGDEDRTGRETSS